MSEQLPSQLELEPLTHAEFNSWGKPQTEGYADHAMYYAEKFDQAMIDPVTGLKNRIALERDLPRAFRGNLGVAYIDINGLNRVNKLPGKHAAGDKYLSKIALRLKSELRFGQDIYRGGDKSDEIIILAQDVNADEMAGFLERLRKAGDNEIESMHLPDSVYPGVSIGGAIKQAGDTPETLLKRADNHCEDEKNRFYDAILQETGMELRR